MSRRIVIVMYVCLALTEPGRAQDLKIRTVSRDDALLRFVDVSTGVTQSSVLMTMTGANILGATGLVQSPTTGALLGILKLQGLPNRSLVRINVFTGECTLIGDTGDRFAGIAFADTLYGVTGDGATPPETLYVLDETDASASFFMTLGHGNDGEALAGDPAGGILYHTSGLGLPNIDEIFETIDPTTLVVTPIILTGDDYNEVAAMTLVDPSRLILGDTEGDLYNLSTSGVVTILSSMDHVAKGIVLLPSCAGDFNDDNAVNVADLLLLLAAWGACPPPCPSDTNVDGEVNVSDLLAFLSNWGSCNTPDP